MLTRCLQSKNGTIALPDTANEHDTYTDVQNYESINHVPSDASEYGEDVKSGQSTTTTLTSLNSSNKPLCNT